MLEGGVRSMIGALIIIGLMFASIAWAIAWTEVNDARERTRRAEILSAREAARIHHETMQ